MEYNTQQPQLLNGEYGRHLQKMVEYVCSIRNRDMRNEQAKCIVRAMANLASGPKDTEDFWHNLWDQLFILSDFKLDIDSPFGKPPYKTAVAKPERLPYPKHNITFRPYGYLMENIIKKIAEENSNENKQPIVDNVAKHLKKQYLSWNRDSVSDELIIEHLQQLSNNKLQLSEDFVFPTTKALLLEINEEKAAATTTKKNQPATKVAAPIDPLPKKTKKKKKKKKKSSQPTTILSKN